MEILNKTQPHKLKVLYIAGAARSGSTLLARLLGQEKFFFDGGELRFFWERGAKENQLCGCGQHLKDCPTWGEVLGKLNPLVKEAQLDIAIESDRELGRVRNFFFLWRKKFHTHMEIYISGFLSPLYTEINRVVNNKIIIDASKSPSYLFLLSKIGFVELYVVHIFRDCRAVAFSSARKKRKPEITDKVVYMKQFSTAWASAVWLVANIQIFLVSLLLKPKRYIGVRYEDIVENPAQEVGRIADFAGVKAELACFSNSKEVTLSPTHTVAGNPMRFKNGLLTIKNDTGWQTNMTFRNKLIAKAFSIPMFIFKMMIRFK